MGARAVRARPKHGDAIFPAGAAGGFHANEMAADKRDDFGGLRFALQLRAADAISCR